MEEEEVVGGSSSKLAGMGSLLPMRSFQQPPRESIDATDRAGELYRKYMARSAQLPAMDKKKAIAARRCVE
eukprot:2785460-Prymnesium_polylepis.1